MWLVECIQPRNVAVEQVTRRFRFHFSGLGSMWALVWIVYGFYAWQVLTRSYFEQRVFTADGLWPKLNRFVPITALLVFYRAAFFYGTSRWIAWTIWAHVVHHYPYDLS